MSGVYIHGMEMPVTCCHCAFMYFDPDATNSNNRNPGSYVCSFTKEEIWNTQRDPNCPLTPIPEHGRLIDADAFVMEAINSFMDCADLFDDANSLAKAAEITDAFIRDINEAPTIIPAEEGKQEAGHEGR